MLAAGIQAQNEREFAKELAKERQRDLPKEIRDMHSELTGVLERTRKAWAGLQKAEAAMEEMLTEHTVAMKDIERLIARCAELAKERDAYKVILKEKFQHRVSSLEKEAEEARRELEAADHTERWEKEMEGIPSTRFAQLEFK
jgi:hypothetical protein